MIIYDRASRTGDGKLAARAMKPPWRRHELVSKAIFEVLLKQSNADNLTVQHNVTIQGLKTKHQVDVLWEFRHGGTKSSRDRAGKKRNQKAKKGDFL
jgi:hypothetical protein